MSVEKPEGKEGDRRGKERRNVTDNGQGREVDSLNIDSRTTLARKPLLLGHEPDHRREVHCEHFGWKKPRAVSSGHTHGERCGRPSFEFPYILNLPSRTLE